MSTDTNKKSGASLKRIKLAVMKSLKTWQWKMLKKIESTKHILANTVVNKQNLSINSTWNKKSKEKLLVVLNPEII